MTVYSQVPETYAVYTITGPDGTRAVINDASDPDYVGTFGDEGISGLDSPEIRENAWDLVEADGGAHGNFWFGRRPVTMTLDVVGVSVGDRNAKLEKIKRASNALRADGLLSWTTPSVVGAPNQQISFRRQQPLRIDGAWRKSCFLGLVAADPRIYSTALHTQTIAQNSSGVITNQGDWNSPPSLRLNGPGTNPTLTANGLSIKFQGMTLGVGEYIIIDMMQRTVVHKNGSNYYGFVDFLNTAWWLLASGDNTVSQSWASGSTAASTLVVSWRDAWV